MQKKVIIIGNSHFSEIIYEHITQDTDWSVVAFAADRDFIKADSISGTAVIPIEEMDNEFDGQEVSLIMAVGYGNGNRTRRKLFEECTGKGFHFTNYIHSSVLCAERVSMGKGNIIFPGVTIDSYVKIGDGNIILPQVMIGHDVEIGHFCAVSGGTLLGGSAKIGDMSFIGMGVVIRDQISISREAYIGASCYIHKNVSEGQCVLPDKSKYLDEHESQIFKELYQ